MDNTLLDLALPLLFASGLGILGGISALFWKESDRVRSYMLHFAAGILAAVIAADLFPKIRADGVSTDVLVSFAIGAVLMIGIKVLSEWLESRDDNDIPYGLGITAALDTAIDGFIIGAGFAASGTLGTVLAIALGLELFVLMLSVSFEYQAHGASKWLSISLTTGIALLLSVGAVSGFLILGGQPDPIIANVLAFAAAALLYLVFEELISKGQEARRSPVTVAFFFLGFLALMSFTLFTGA
jgi:zinc transporter, ZIP family